MNLNKALSSLLHGAQFTRDNYGWHIVRKPDNKGNRHHTKLRESTARALMARGYTPELKYTH